MDTENVANTEVSRSHTKAKNDDSTPPLELLDQVDHVISQTKQLFF